MVHSLPPPLYNFAITPEVTSADPFWTTKQTKTAKLEKPHYTDIHVPKDTHMGLLIGKISLTLGFAIIWHIFWLAAASFLSIIACLIVRLSDDDVEYCIPAEEVEQIENGARYT